MRFLRRGDDPYTFATTMIGVKLGDRLLQLGCADGALLAALAGKVGLTGRACGVDRDDDALAKAQAAAARAGVLVELQRAPYTDVPFDAGSFDVVILRGILLSLATDARGAAAAEALRVLRPGGRAIVVDTARRGGLGALFASRPAADPSYDAEDLLRKAGCRAVRTLAEREGLRFVEGVVGR
jgi:ubiquinone/menaquinone biosynthesis C-methylase UbiE